MSDLDTTAHWPSYRVRPERAGVPWRMVAVSGGIAATLGVVGLAGWALTRAVSRDVPVVAADDRPFRVRPDDPGGLRVPNQDERIFESGRRRPSGAPPASTGAREQVASEPERPNLDGLRAAVTPAHPVPAPAPAPQAAVPAASTPVAPAPAGRAPAVAAPVAPAATGAAHAPPPAATATAPPVPATAPTAAAVPAPTTPAATASGRYQVQLGALASEAAARAEWERLNRRLGDLLDDRRPQVMRFEREGMPTMFRLRTGSFSDAAAARAFCDVAKAKGAPACAPINQSGG